MSYEQTVHKSAWNDPQNLYRVVEIWSHRQRLNQNATNLGEKSFSFSVEIKTQIWI